MTKHMPAATPKPTVKQLALNATAKKQIIGKYTASIKRYFKSVDKVCTRKDNQEEIRLQCAELPQDQPLPKLFSRDPKTGKLQFSIAFNNCRKRPVAWRVPFLESPHFDNKSMTVSHLCHNNKCHNPEHLALEPLAVNKGRNGCPAGYACQHEPKCLRPGQQSGNVL